MLPEISALFHILYCCEGEISARRSNKKSFAKENVDKVLIG